MRPSWGRSSASRPARLGTERGAGPKTDLGSKPGTLSDKLGSTGGVIAPTGDIDPEMHKPTPQAGSMPVIKPGQIAPQSGGGTGVGQGGLY